jgi:hypothetical protein
MKRAVCRLLHQGAPQAWTDSGGSEKVSKNLNCHDPRHSSAAEGSRHAVLRIDSTRGQRRFESQYTLLPQTILNRHFLASMV